jgi:hypothetical protein
MPASGEMAEVSGTFVDNHGHEVDMVEGALFPPCPEGQTWWWHEDLPIVKQLRWEAQRPPRPGGLRDLLRERFAKQGKSEQEIDDLLRGLH